MSSQEFAISSVLKLPATHTFWATARYKLHEVTTWWSPVCPFGYRPKRVIESRNSIFSLDGINQQQYPIRVDNQSFLEQPTRFCIYQLRQRGSNTHEGNVCVVFRKRNICKHKYWQNRTTTNIRRAKIYRDREGWIYMNLISHDESCLTPRTVIHPQPDKYSICRPGEYRRTQGTTCIMAYNTRQTLPFWKVPGDFIILH